MHGNDRTSIYDFLFSTFQVQHWFGFARSFWSFVGLAASEIQDLQVGQLPLSTIMNHNQAKVSTIILLVLKVSSIQVHAICSMLWLQPISVVVKIHVFGLLHKLYLCKGQCHVAFDWCFILEEEIGDYACLWTVLTWEMSGGGPFNQGLSNHILPKAHARRYAACDRIKSFKHVAKLWWLHMINQPKYYFVYPSCLQVLPLVGKTW